MTIQSTKWIGWLSLAFAGIGILATWGFGLETIKFKAAAISAEATVVELIRRSGDDADTFAPLLRFQDLQKRQHEFASRSSSYPPTYSIGDRVTILYDPNLPAESARLDTFLELWIGTIATGLLTIACALFGFVMLNRLQKENCAVQPKSI